MEYLHKEDENNIEIKLKGNFTFADNKSFLAIIENTISKKYKTLIFDLAEVDFVDSAALGVLLLARDKCTHRGINLILQNPQGQVKQMFKISMFDALFTIV